MLVRFNQVRRQLSSRHPLKNFLAFLLSSLSLWKLRSKPEDYRLLDFHTSFPSSLLFFSLLFLFVDFDPFFWICRLEWNKNHDARDSTRSFSVCNKENRSDWSIAWRKIRCTDRQNVNRAAQCTSSTGFCYFQDDLYVFDRTIFFGQHLAVHTAVYSIDEDWPKARRIRALPDTKDSRGRLSKADIKGVR